MRMTNIRIVFNVVTGVTAKGSISLLHCTSQHIDMIDDE